MNDDKQDSISAKRSKLKVEGNVPLGKMLQRELNTSYAGYRGKNNHF